MQPIDLQTMYSQVDNVAKQASHLQQGAQLSESFQQMQFARLTQQQAQVVQQTNEQNELGNINQDGRQSSGNQKNQKKSENPQAEENENRPSRLKEDYLGQHIDISR